MASPEAGGEMSGSARPSAVPPTLPEQRGLHLQMIAAVMDSGGLERLAELANEAAGLPVAIVVPRLGDAVAPATSLAAPDRERLLAYVRGRMARRPVELPGFVAAEAHVTTGDALVGAIIALADPDTSGEPDLAGVLDVTALAALTELAAASAREEADDALRSSLIELIRGDPGLPEEEILRRAHRLGADLSAGGVALCAELKHARPQHVVGIIREEHPQVLAEHLNNRIYALLPALPDADPATEPLQSAQRLVKALAGHATVGFSSFCSTPERFPRAIAEAEVVVDVLEHELAGNGAAEDADEIRSATFRLLINTMASKPDEIEQFYEDTVAPLVHHDSEYSTDLVGTVEAYLRHNCNMNATAAAMYAHRHTIAYRLDRVRELAKLDPSRSEDRERLGLGLKAFRILAPRLRR
ncbi:MAG: helix-turn-helix domain-containing protein [Actinobacteria bacterium]|nr:helix-turn-helix domain-containing protein [Actinomycetota bacterium]